MRYLWSFSFDELFKEEDGEKLVADYSQKEFLLVDLLQELFEKTAVQARAIINQISQKNFSKLLPELIRQDMILQMCLIYSFNVKEMLFDFEDIIKMIENETCQYFHEYRIFGIRYKFEAYSIMNQLDKLNR